MEWGATVKAFFDRGPFSGAILPPQLTSSLVFRKKATDRTVLSVATRFAKLRAVGCGATIAI